jgi:8-oxo-dGTP pyrophosphatase MutT (NUDIX family)
MWNAELGWLSLVDSLFAVIGTALIAVVGLLRVSPSARRILVTSSLRQAGRSVIWTQFRGGPPAVHPGVRRHFRQCTVGLCEGQEISSAEALSQALAQTEAENDPSHAEVKALLRWLTVATMPGRSPLLGRLITPEQQLLVQDFLRSTKSHLERFTATAQVPWQLARGDSMPTVSPASFASALSGAAVLMDVATGRAGAADSVLTWHSPRFRGSSEHNGESYDAVHTFDSPWDADLVDRLGDYDGRLLDFRGVSLAADPLDGSTSFVIRTSETCYRSTEDAPSTKCKRLSPTTADHTLPVFRRKSDGACLVREGSDTERVIATTAYVSILCTGDGSMQGLVRGLPEGASDEYLVLALCRRSLHTRNGAGTLSATAGGVVELPTTGKVADIDQFGSPSLLAAVTRETREEIGLDLDPDALHPVSVWLATVRGSETPAGGPQGQLVACGLYLSTTQLSFEELVSRRHASNFVKGGFEVDGLEGIALLRSAEGASTFASEVRALADRLDQHGLLSCFYTAVRTYGASQSIRAFGGAFADMPWWALPWSGELHNRPRVCRDVRQILPDEGTSIVSAVPGWQQHWATLSDRLDLGDGKSLDLSSSRTGRAST